MLQVLEKGLVKERSSLSEAVIEKLEMESCVREQLLRKLKTSGL